MWRPQPLRSAFEEFLVLGVAPLGLLSLARKASHDVGTDTGPVPRSWIWIAVGLGGFGLFLLIQARGLGSNADAALPP